MAASDERKVKSLRDLSPSIEPPRDLWPGIEARLRTEPAIALTPPVARALGKDPSNQLLQELLINTYQDEMRALTDVHESSDPGGGI